MANISQTNTFGAGVGAVYSAFADESNHAAFTSAPVKMGTEVGSAFTTHGGAIEGLILELVPNVRIVHAWRPADWPAGIFSVVRYEFSGNEDSTEVKLTHDALPEDAASHIADGWDKMYWEPLAAHFGG